jgi:nicotinamidase-related amidase
MTLSTLDDRAALISVDLQNGTLRLPTVEPVGSVVHLTSELAVAFRARDFPVVLVTVAGRPPGRTDHDAWGSVEPAPDWSELAEGLSAQTGDYLISKRARSAFQGTNLDHVLRDNNVSQVFLTGVVTSGGVESTARAAYDYGYNVVLVTDAMTDTDTVAHAHSIRAVFPRLGETAESAEVIRALEQSRQPGLHGRGK